MRSSRVALYCPGHKREMFEKALSSDADEVILDLQDSVPSDQKEQALENVMRFLAEYDFTQKPIQVRPNPERDKDVEALAAFGSKITLRVPQAEHPLGSLFELGFQRIIPLIETAKGVVNMQQIAESPGTVMLAMGEADLVGDLSSSSHLMINHIRAALIIGSRAAELPRPMMSAWTKLSDQEGLLADCRAGLAMGFYGRTAIHPKQIPVIIAGFAASALEQQFSASMETLGPNGGVGLDVDGNMIDTAWLRRRNLNE